MKVVLFWTHNETVVIHQNNIMFSPSDLNHSITITNIGTSDSGIYTCHATLSDGRIVEQNITLSVIEGMNYTQYIKALWQTKCLMSRRYISQMETKNVLKWFSITLTIFE